MMPQVLIHDATGKTISEVCIDWRTLYITFTDGTFAALNAEIDATESCVIRNRQFMIGFGTHNEAALRLHIVTSEEVLAAQARASEEQRIAHEHIERRVYETLKKKFEGK